MKLQELLKGVAVLSSTADGEAEIGEVRYDSRAVGKGDLFVAIRGYATDGHKYIEKALEQGAAAVVCEEAPEGAPAVVVENSRKALAEIAANRFGHPADSMVMLGVTGTNGKTTTTYLVKHMLEDAGHKVGLIGTNQNLIGDEVIETERTTPESYELHALFARMRDAGCTHVIMEVSSHSLVLDRVHGIPFAVGAFTNLTQDHLDFHKTMEEYRKAKALLFSISKKGVINLDDAAAEKMLADAKCPCMTFSCGKPEADLEATDLQLHADGVEFTKAWVLNWDKVAQAGWFSVPKLIPVKPVFDLRAILPVLVMFIVTAVETVGDISGVMEGGMGREATDRELSGGVSCDGLGSSFAALFGVLPNTSFSQNVGLVTMTKVVNRGALSIGAIFLILCGLIPKLGAIVSIMPQSVLGGAAVMMFSSIVISGIQLITKEEMTPRNLTIVSVALGVGYGMGANMSILAQAPQAIQLIFGGSGIVPAAFVAIILNILLPKDK